MRIRSIFVSGLLSGFLGLLAGSAQASSAEPASYDAVVIGGGPAGNVFALKLAQQGKRVLVVEKRTAERTRQQIVGIKQLSFDSLHGIASAPEEHRSARYAPKAGVDSHAPAETSAEQDPVRHMVESFSTHTMSIGDLETKLLKSCETDTRVDMQFKSELLEAPVLGEDGHLTMQVRDGAGHVRSIRAPYMVVSDGGGSSTLKQLGIGTRTFARGKVAATFYNQRGRNVMDYGEGVARVADQERTYTLTGLSPAHEGLEGEALAGHVREQARTVGIKKDAKVIKAWTFDATMQYAKRFSTLEGHVMVVGDAASTPHPLTGMGVNKAIYEAEATANAVSKMLATSKPEEQQQALRELRHTMLVSRTSLHAAALPIFQKYGTVEKVPRYLAPRRTK